MGIEISVRIKSSLVLDRGHVLDTCPHSATRSPGKPAEMLPRGGHVARTCPRMSAAIDRTLTALADPHRRHVVELLRVKPRPAGELAKVVGLAPSAMDDIVAR